VHDAVLIEAPLNVLTETIAKTQRIMADASTTVLDGFRLRSDADTFIYPERYMDERGSRMWQAVTGILDELEP
jgi:hypothetical protein